VVCFGALNVKEAAPEGAYSGRQLITAKCPKTVPRLQLGTKQAHIFHAI